MEKSALFSILFSVFLFISKSKVSLGLQRYILLTACIIYIIIFVAHAPASAIISIDYPVDKASYVPGSYAGRSFYYDNVHIGEDISLPLGTPVKAIANGKIVQYEYHSGYATSDDGTSIAAVIEHDLGGTITLDLSVGHSKTVTISKISSIYGHIRKSSTYTGARLPWKVGDYVNKGDIIGYVNDDAYNGDGGVHLHMGLRLTGHPGYWVYFGYQNTGLYPASSVQYFAAASEIISKLSTPTDKFLTKLNPDPYGDANRVYWIQSNKRYHVINETVLNSMESEEIPGWSWSNIFMASNSYTSGPDFISKSSTSNGLYIQRYPKTTYPDVYHINNGEKEHVSFTECNTLNCWGDIIEVTQSIFDMFPTTGTTEITMTTTRTSFDFGTVQSGQTSDQSIIITNAASSSATLTGSVSISGSGFTIASGSGSFSLGLGESKTVTVRFSPTSQGSFSGTLAITNNSTNQSNPLNIPISGTGESSLPGRSIKLPETGQTGCFDSSGAEINCSGTGQDGEIRAGVAWPKIRFSDNGDQTTTDNLTGLIWAKDADTPTVGGCTGGVKTWQQALDYVACLNNSTYKGHSDWRLPNVNELESLVNAGEGDNAAWLNDAAQGFVNVVQGDSYWSSTTDVRDISIAWKIVISLGYVIDGGKSGWFYVWPVRSGQDGSVVGADLWKTGQIMSYATGDDGALWKGVSWPSPRFTDNGNATVTDNLTGLIWSKDAHTPGPSICTPATYKTWQGALDYMTCLNADNYLGFNDWRLPNRKELISLIDRSQHSPVLPTGHPFTNVQSYPYWSSTSYVYSANYAWYVNMWSGKVGSNSKADGNVWPVRGGLTSELAQGDVNGNGTIDLADSIMALQVISGRNPDGVHLESDVNGDNKIGLPEVIYILQKVAGIR